MEKDFEDFIIKRCETAIGEDFVYSQKELSEEVDQDTLQTMAEVICYKKGYSDAMAVILYSQKV